MHSIGVKGELCAQRFMYYEIPIYKDTQATKPVPGTTARFAAAGLRGKQVPHCSRHEVCSGHDTTFYIYAKIWKRLHHNLPFYNGCFYNGLTACKLHHNTG
ncbi:hypothetical protein GCM10007389_17980 [Pontibacter akesuensis]|nr:hypothetical protein GCM10007389_17980 [Pontibacter akesuensis]